MPECCDYIGTNREETVSLAEPLNGGTVSFYKQLAKRFNVWLSLGGIHEITNIEVNEFQCSYMYNVYILVKVCNLSHSIILGKKLTERKIVQLAYFN